MNKLKKKHFFILIAFIATFLIGALLGYFVSSENLSRGETFGEIRSGGFKFINPLYECNVPENYGSVQFKDLERNISDYIDNILADNRAQRVSVYFRDLNNGPWFGINENEAYKPSSLFKLPVMMVYLKKAELNPNIFNEKILYEKEIVPSIIPINDKVNPLVVGSEYTIGELIEKMITESDNVSSSLLSSNISKSELDQVSKDLGLPTLNTLDDFISVREYSSLFRILYNASYLSKKYSEEALGILEKATFSDGLRKTIPENVKVAHKFGESRQNNLLNSTDYQLHDCGIIYYSNRPYLLCVMSEGKSYENLKKVIQDISQEVFTEYNRRYNAY